MKIKTYPQGKVIDFGPKCPFCGGQLMPHEMKKRSVPKMRGYSHSFQEVLLTEERIDDIVYKCTDCGTEIKLSINTSAGVDDRFSDK